MKPTPEQMQEAMDFLDKAGLQGSSSTLLRVSSSVSDRIADIEDYDEDNWAELEN